MHNICITSNWTIKIVNKYWLEAATKKTHFRLTTAYSRYDKIHWWYSCCWKIVSAFSCNIHHGTFLPWQWRSSWNTKKYHNINPKTRNIIFYMSLVSRKVWKLIVLLLFPLCLSFFLCTTWKTCASLNILVQFLV